MLVFITANRGMFLKWLSPRCLAENCNLWVVTAWRTEQNLIAAVRGNIIWSRAVVNVPLIIKQNIFFDHISLLNSINTDFTPFKLYLECHRFCEIFLWKSAVASNINNISRYRRCCTLLWKQPACISSSVQFTCCMWGKTYCGNFVWLWDYYCVMDVQNVCHSSSLLTFRSNNQVRFYKSFWTKEKVV